MQNVYRIKIDGTNLQQLTTVDRVGVFDNYNPSWSPDGTRIAFQSERVFRAIWKRGLGVRDDETIKENGGSSSERAVFDHDRSKRMVKSEHRARKSLAAKSNEWIHLRRAPGRNVAGE